MLTAATPRRPLAAQVAPRACYLLLLLPGLPGASALGTPEQLDGRAAGWQHVRFEALKRRLSKRGPVHGQFLRRRAIAVDRLSRHDGGAMFSEAVVQRCVPVGVFVKYAAAAHSALIRAEREDTHLLHRVCGGAVGFEHQLRLGAQDFVRAAAREKRREVRHSIRRHAAAHAELIHAATLLTARLPHVARLAGEPRRVYRAQYDRVARRRPGLRARRTRTRIIEFPRLALARRRGMRRLILWRGRESHRLPRATAEGSAVAEHFPCAREAVRIRQESPARPGKLAGRSWYLCARVECRRRRRRDR